MNWILKIAPNELRLLDVYLREKYPWIWATRIHFTLYAMLLLGAFATIIGLITPVDIQNPMSSSDIMTFFGIFMFPTIICMGYIIFQLCLFSVEKRKGKSSFFRPLIVFPLMMLSVLSPLIMPYSIAFVLNAKTGNLAEEEQIHLDGLEIRKAKFFLNTGSGAYHYFESEKKYLDYWNDTTGNTVLVADEYQREKIKSKKDGIYFHKDGYEEQRPRLYKAKSYSNYNNNSYYDKEWSSNKETLNKVVLFYHAQNLNLSITQAKKSLTYLNECIERYSIKAHLPVDSLIYELEHNIYTGYYTHLRSLNPNRNSSYNNEKYLYHNIHVRPTYNKLHRNVSLIERAQTSLFPKDVGFVIIAFLWASFIITLLLFIFRLVHWKQFLLNILITGIYFTIIGIVEGVGRFHGDFFPIMAVLFVIMSMIFLNRVWSLKKFSVVINQMSIVTFCSFPFFPVMILGYLDNVWDVFEIDYFDKYLLVDGNSYRPYTEEYYELVSSIWSVTFFAGLMFFYFIGLPYLKKVFLRLMSLPKNN
jgi:hypothetical protein